MWALVPCAFLVLATPAVPTYAAPLTIQSLIQKPRAFYLLPRSQNVVAQRPGLPPSAVAAVKTAMDVAAKRRSLVVAMEARLDEMRARQSNLKAPATAPTDAGERERVDGFRADLATLDAALGPARRKVIEEIGRLGPATAVVESLRGDLLLDEAEGEYTRELLNCLEQASAAAATNPPTPVPPEPLRRFGPAIAAYDRAAAMETDPANRAISLYSAGYSLFEMGDLAGAIDRFRRALAVGPPPALAGELHFRIGEMEFDEPAKLDAAKAHYREAIRLSSQPIHATALYKLGWCHYRADDFAHAVEVFARLVDEGGASPEDSALFGGNLREEALTHIAYSFANESWGGMRRAEETMKKLGAPAWQDEVWLRLGGTFTAQARYKEALAAFARAVTSTKNDVIARRANEGAARAQRLMAGERPRRQ